MVLLQGGVDKMQATKDAQDEMICCLFKARLIFEDTPWHGAPHICSSKDDFGAMHWVGYVRNLDVKVYVGLCSLAYKQRNHSDSKLSVPIVKIKLYVKLKRSLIMSDAKLNQVT